MDVRRVVGANIRRFRLAAELSQELLAERMGVDRAYISGLEIGRFNPTVITLWRVAEALGVPVSKLLEMPRDLENGGDGTAPKRARRRKQ